MRAVIDTGVLVSALMRRRSTPGEILEALRSGRFRAVYTLETLLEVVDVLGRPAMRQKYHIEPGDISALINLIQLRGEIATVGRRVNACRDPKDNKFLDAALAGSVDCIVSGDMDLLILTPFEGIPILRPAEFLPKLEID